MRNVEPKGEARLPVRELKDPDPGRGPRYRVVRLKGGDSFDCYILSESFWGVQVHWNAKLRRTEPCLEDETTCPGHKANMPIKRKFYLFVSHAGQKPFFLEFTEEAAFEIKEYLAGESSYVGIRMEFFRTKADNGRIGFRLKEEYGERKKFKPAPHPLETLRVLWAWGRDDARPELT